MATQQRPAPYAPPPPPPAPPEDADRAVERACPNCGTPAPLAYCPACGQAQHDLHRSLRAWADELLDAFAGWDGKIPTTLRLLVRHPGRLTAEYLAGRRARYLPPLRLYLTLSVVFFLVLRATPGDAGSGGGFSVNFGEDTLRVGGAAPAARADSIRAVTVRRDRAWRDSVRRASTTRDSVRPGVAAADTAGDTWLDRKYKERKRALAAMPKEQRTRALRDKLQGSLLPNMVFLLLPVFALLVKLLNRRAPVYYAEHLVFALHTHAFFMLAMTAARLVPAKAAGPAAVAGMAGYLFVALRRVYGGSRRRTLAKLAALLAVYGVVLGLSVAVTAVLALALAA